jgi:hypothetical protein
MEKRGRRDCAHEDEQSSEPGPGAISLSHSVQTKPR